MSAQPCGCDPEVPWVCRVHQEIETPINTTPRVKLPPEFHFGDDDAVAHEECLPAAKAAPARATTLPDEPKARKQYPVASGVLDYFPDAIAAVSHVSFVGNEQHNPGQPLHWAREKSTDEADTMQRHFLQRGSLDKDGIRHTAKMAWRALALLQKEIEGEGR